VNLRVIETTDNQYLGAVVPVPYADLAGVDIPMGVDIIFSIVHYEDLGNGKHKYSNAHYVAICEEV